MEEYVIISDSTTDLSKDLVEEAGLKILPLKFSMSGKVYQNSIEEKDMTTEEFYTRLRSGEMPTTSQINPEDFIEFFKPYLQKGTDIIYISFSSALSNTYSSAVIAQKELLQSFPDRKIEILDSLCASMGEGLLVYLAAQQKNSGKSFEEVKNWVNEMKLHICHWFTVDDLNHLKRGGRVSSAAAILGSMLNIKPILHVDNSGKLALASKSRGRKKSIVELLNRMQSTAINLKNQTVFISHGDCLSDAQEMAKVIKEKYEANKVIVNSIGPVIGSHSGPGTLALFFIGTTR